MPVRKTESRLPQNLQAKDLGEAVVAADGRCAVVSYLTAPLAAGHANTYVVFVTDAGLAGAIKSFEWTFDEDGAFPFVQSTDIGEITYQTGNVGNLSLTGRGEGSSGLGFDRIVDKRN